MVSRNEQMLGAIAYESLPVTLKLQLKALKKERQKHLFMGTVVAVATAVGKPTSFSVAIGAMSLTHNYNKKVRSWTKQVGATAAWEGNKGDTERLQISEQRTCLLIEN